MENAHIFKALAGRISPPSPASTTAIWHGGNRRRGRARAAGMGLSRPPWAQGN